jgi:hypothetical protein
LLIVSGIALSSKAMRGRREIGALDPLLSHAHAGMRGIP